MEPLIYNIKSDLKYFLNYLCSCLTEAGAHASVSLASLRHSVAPPLITESMTLNLPSKPYLALSGAIRNPVEFIIRYGYYPESGIWWNFISRYTR